MPLSNWKAKSIQDENEKDDDFFKNLKLLDEEYKITETLTVHSQFDTFF